MIQNLTLDTKKTKTARQIGATYEKAQYVRHEHISTCQAINAYKTTRYILYMYVQSSSSIICSFVSTICIVHPKLHA